MARGRGRGARGAARGACLQLGGSTVGAAQCKGACACPSPICATTVVYTRACLSCDAFIHGPQTPLHAARCRLRLGLQALCLIALAASRAANIYPLSLLCNLLRPIERRITQKEQFMMWWSGACGWGGGGVVLRVRCAKPIPVAKPCAVA